MTILESLKDPVIMDKMKLYFDKISKRNEIESKQIERFHKKYSHRMKEITELAMDKYDSIEYRDKWYGRGIMPPELFYFFLFDVASTYGEEVEPKGLFCHEAYQYKGYEFQKLFGQGTIILIKEI